MFENEETQNTLHKLYADINEIISTVRKPFFGHRDWSWQACILRDIRS